MTVLLLFILTGVLLPHFGLPQKVNQVIAIVLMVVALILFIAWPEIQVRDVN
jgi:hypothetical protein